MVLTGLVAVLMVAQLALLGSEARQLRTLVARQDRSLEQLTIMEQNRADFDAAVEKLAAATGRLERLLPREPEAELAMEKLASLSLRVSEESRAAGKGGLTLRWVGDPEPGTWERCAATKVEVDLCGDLESIKGYLTRTTTISRLTIWDRSTRPTAAACLAFSTRILFLPDEPASEPPPERFEEVPVTRVWLWPITTRIAALREKALSRRAELVRRAPIVTYVKRAMARKQQLEERVHLIDALHTDAPARIEALFTSRHLPGD